MTNLENTHSRICILMATLNGEKFLAEQLQSIENQTHKNWRVVISDDGSIDNTVDISKQFQQKLGNNRIEIRKGPQQGFCQNFLSMACDTSIRADYYAFSDQDDVWMTDKFVKAIKYFETSNESQLPRVYCGRTIITNANLKPIGFSPLFALPRSFRNALVQSIAGGNTMVFNHAAKELLEKAGPLQVVSHDWWLYQIVMGAGGIVYYDPEPSVLYRQHQNCAIGENKSFKSKIERLGFVLNGRFKAWNTKNYEALCIVQHLLTKDCRDILETFGKFRGARFKDRIRLLEVCGLYRQTWRGTLSFFIATIINKV